MSDTENKELEYKLVSNLNDTLTFEHEDGRELALQILPHPQNNGQLALYEIWAKGPPGRLRRLFTERGFEAVFELPLLLEHQMKVDGYPSDATTLVKKFFAGMVGETFTIYPKTLFK